MGVIREMPESLARLIAAGEVVQRPASAVKELVENALDADASRVDVAIENGGLRRIRVADDGTGIADDDLEPAFVRHATSKIHTEEDLERIRTFGFRGEALASIYEVARVRIHTCQPGEPVGASIRANFGRVGSPEPAARQPGTTVEVEQLFARVPARLEFLGSVASETNRCVRVVREAALARPDVGFRIESDDRELLSVEPAADLLERIGQVYGTGFTDTLVPVAADAAGTRIAGFVTRPDSCPRRATKSVIMVNGRPVNLPAVRGSIKQAFRDRLVAGQHPEMLLHIELRPDTVDPNVAPDKSVVRVRADDRLASLAYRAVQHALDETGRSRMSASAGRRSALSLTGQAASMGDLAPVDETGAEEPRLELVFESEAPSASAPRRAPRGPIAQLDRTLLLVPVEGGMLMVDQHSLHERVLYERLARQEAPVDQQTLAIPERFEVPDLSDAFRFEDLRAGLEAAGFEIAEAGHGDYFIHAVPAWDSTKSPAQALRNAIAALDRDVRLRGDVEEVRERLYSTIACKAAVKAGDPLTQSEMRALWEQGAELDLALTDVHGRPGAVFVAYADLYRKLGR